MPVWSGGDPVEPYYMPALRRHFGDERRRNLELVADMICDGYPVTLNFKLDRWKMARYLVARGDFHHIWPAYLRTLRFLRFLPDSR